MLPVAVWAALPAALAVGAAAVGKTASPTAPALVDPPFAAAFEDGAKLQAAVDAAIRKGSKRLRWDACTARD